MTAHQLQTPIVLAAGWRLPQARAGLAYAREDAGNLGARIARELVARSGIAPEELDDLICGCVGPPHDQANIGRVIGLRAGLPRGLAARTVARNCASGMEAVTEAAIQIEAGLSRTVLCVGVEVMSAYPLIYNRKGVEFFARLSRARSLGQKIGALAAARPALFAPRIALSEGLTDPTTGLIMGKTAEILAREFGISREAADSFALESHRRAKAARDSGRLAREIVPHLPQGAKPGSAALEHDDGIRDDQSLAALAKLKPYFEKLDGRVTVGNSCGITDGACALLVMREDRARELGQKPLARIKSFAWSGCDPARMGLGPVHASALALDRAGVQLGDLDVVEINEAFAAQVLAVQRAFDSQAYCKQQLGRAGALGALDPAKLNRNGGAIALGHPVGVSGARLLLSAAHELALCDGNLALASLCIGGGQGGAVLLERASA